MTKTENNDKITKTIKSYKKKIDSKLRRFLEARIKKVQSISPATKEMMENILEFNLRGGKRIRPILVIMGYKAAGGKETSQIIDASLAVELMESYLLIHDDIMDQDELRRGYLTMHKIYENKCKRCLDGDAQRYGETMAIIAGDILAVLGSEAILGTNFTDSRKLKALERFNRAVVNTCFGQLLDVKTGLQKNVKEEDIRRLYELKTAIYTFEAPLQIGALLAGASQSTLSALSKYAIPLGKAFQLQDDVLGLFGTKKRIGKPVGNDIREGKKTILILKTLELCNKKQKIFINKCLGNQDITIDDVKKIRQIIKESGALDYSTQEAKKLVNKAKDAIKDSTLKKSGKEFLLGLADYVIRRDH